MTEQLDESLDARVPEALIASQPVVCSSEWPWIDAAVVNPSAHGSLHESGTLERLDVFRRRREGDAKGRREFAHGLLAPCEALQHRATRAVPECAEDEVEACRLMFNHMVECTRAVAIVNPMVE